jgi:hypothetical protein
MHESFSDCTKMPHHHLDVIDGQLHLGDPPPVLRDDALWAELLAAQRSLRDVEGRVVAACTIEPLDDVEIALGMELNEMLGDMLLDQGERRYDRKRWDEVEDQLIEHAKRASPSRICLGGGDAGYVGCGAAVPPSDPLLAMLCDACRSRFSEGMLGGGRPPPEQTMHDRGDSIGMVMVMPCDAPVFELTDGARVRAPD